MANEYTMKISRLTVDKLGVKLYDRVSAVIAELISNSYDADATEVVVCAPMGQYLATRAGGSVSDKGFEIRVIDDGAGMTPGQTGGMQQFFLVIGAERRNDPRRGDVSPWYRRKVMGRKGVGKLAPFGICKVIEVISSGGEKIERDGEEGFLTSHVIMNYDDIMAEGGDETEQYQPKTGELDDTLRDRTGTSITMKEFNFRRVPKIEDLSRQIAQRFGIESENWRIMLQDNVKTSGDQDYSRTVGAFDVETMPNTRISFQREGGLDRVVGPDGSEISDLRPGFEYSGRFYPINGWVAYAKNPYKDDLMAGIRIYCRGKIAAQTSVFERRAGFTGEHNVRSYLVGELRADWLDEDDDLIQTDRRDVLWSEELGTAFQEWGQRVVQKIGTLSRDPMRKATLELFLETGQVDERVRKAYPSENEDPIREKAVDVAKMLGRTVSRSNAEDQAVVEDLVDLSIALAPHITLDGMMREAAEQTDTPLAALSAILRTARIAELSSFGRIAQDRLKVIDRLETLKDSDETKEDSLQNLIEDAPWLINPEWAPVVANQALGTLRREFEKYYARKTGVIISLSDFENPNRRPDFVLSSQEGIAQIIEIKKPKHSLKDEEMDRIVSYHDNVESFLDKEGNQEIRKFFKDFHITLVCDEISLTGSQRAAYVGYVASGKLTHLNWTSFLSRTQTVHQDFLTEAQRQKKLASSRRIR